MLDGFRLYKLPRYFRNLQRLTEIVRILAKHGFGDLIARLQLSSLLPRTLEELLPPLRTAPTSSEMLTVGQRARLAIEALGPTFIKFGQVMSTRPDLFPVEITEELRKLQDRVPPVPFAEILDVLHQELDSPPHDVFDTIVEQPLAAASIGQVHKATLMDGSLVVIKVQRPKIKSVIESDLEILVGLATLLEQQVPESQQYSPIKLVQEFSRSLRLELNFEREARSMQRFAELFADYPLLIIPQVYHSFSTKRVLTQQYIEGVRIDDYERLFPKGSPQIIDTFRCLTKVILTATFSHGFFHGDPHPGNVFVTPSGQVALLDFGSMGRLDRSRAIAVIRFLLAVFQHDVDSILRILRENYLTTSTTDEISLKNQIADVLDLHLGKSLGELDLASLLADIFEVVRRFGLRPPPDLLLVARVLSMLHFIGSKVDPAYDPVAILRPFLAEQLKNTLIDPGRALKSLGLVSESYLSLLHDLPFEMHSLFRSIALNQFSIAHRIHNFAEVAEHQNRLANRCISGIAGIIFTALGLYLLAVPTWRQTPGIVAITIGSLLLINTWRAMRRRGSS